MAKINETDKEVAQYLKERGITYEVRENGTSRRDGGYAQDIFEVRFSRGNDVFSVPFYQGVWSRVALHKQLSDVYKKEYRDIGLPVPRFIAREQHFLDCDRDKQIYSVYKEHGDFIYKIFPTSACVLYSVLLDVEASNQNFYDFCQEFGYSDDSISALETHKLCMKQAVGFRKVFTGEEKAQLKELLEDY